MNYPMYYASPGNKSVVRIDEHHITRLTTIINKTASGELIEAETSLRATKYTENDLVNIRREYALVDASYFINHLSKLISNGQTELTTSLNELVNNYRNVTKQNSNAA